MPEPTELRAERPARVPGGRELHPWLERLRLRAVLDRFLAHRVRLRRGSAKEPATLMLADLWNAWSVAELECALALRAWQLAPRRDKEGPYVAYCRALEREALIAAQLCLRAGR